jgi:hypothetical protein
MGLFTSVGSTGPGDGIAAAGEVERGVVENTGSAVLVAVIAGMVDAAVSTMRVGLGTGVGTRLLQDVRKTVARTNKRDLLPGILIAYLPLPLWIWKRL